MSTLFSSLTEKSEYLFVPSNPAANGRLHLGHISGPYMTADIHARHRKRQGHQVSTLFGIDAYNSYVTRNAELEKTSSAAIANKNYQLIKEDLQALGIHYDTFTNPIDSRWSQQYEEKHSTIFQQLLDKGKMKVLAEQSPYSNNEAAFKPDYWISGTCPECGAGMGGFGCEQCGAYLYPDSILNQVSERGEALVFRPVDNYCLDIETVPMSLDDFSHYHFPPAVLDIISQHITKRNGWFKLTQHFDWGLNIDVNGESRTIASFMTEYIYNIMHGDLYAASMGHKHNPYSPESSVKIICSIGIDNVIAQVFGKKMMSKALGHYKADHGFLINHFLNLEGEKFSTSRRHAIWASDIVKRTPAVSDGVRLYLALNAPIKPGNNFDIQDFIQLYNNALHNKLNKALKHCLTLLSANRYATEIDQTVIGDIEAMYLRQEKALQDNHVNPITVATTILEWLDHPAKSTSQAHTAYWWLKGLSLLSYPVMPDLSERLWQCLAISDMPTLEHFLTDCLVSEELTTAINSFAQLSDESVEACLPDSVLSEA